MKTLKPIYSGIDKKFRKAARELTREVNEELRDTAEAMISDFDKTTRTWKNRPDFQVTRTENGYVIGTEEIIYAWVDEGTKPHIIRAKNPSGLLTFALGGMPKTTPNVIGSVKGKQGKTWRRKQQVRHPGTKPRNFTKIIFQKWQPKLHTRITNRLKRGMEAVGI